jgi:hypothetical protein
MPRLTNFGSRCVQHVIVRVGQLFARVLCHFFEVCAKLMGRVGRLTGGFKKAHGRHAPTDPKCRKEASMTEFGSLHNFCANSSFCGVIGVLWGWQ